MECTKWLSEGKSTGPRKWNGTIDDLKLFINEVVGVEESHWDRKLHLLN